MRYTARALQRNLNRPPGKETAYLILFIIFTIILIMSANNIPLILRLLPSPSTSSSASYSPSPSSSSGQWTTSLWYCSSFSSSSPSFSPWPAPFEGSPNSRRRHLRFRLNLSISISCALWRFSHQQKEKAKKKRGGEGERRADRMRPQVHISPLAGGYITSYRWIYYLLEVDITSYRCISPLPGAYDAVSDLVVIPFPRRSEIQDQ